jgi:hypothetical protein
LLPHTKKLYLLGSATQKVEAEGLRVKVNLSKVVKTLSQYMQKGLGPGSNSKGLD